MDSPHIYVFWRASDNFTGISNALVLMIFSLYFHGIIAVNWFCIFHVVAFIMHDLYVVRNKTLSYDRIFYYY